MTVCGGDVFICIWRSHPWENSKENTFYFFVGLFFFWWGGRHIWRRTIECCRHPLRVQTRAKPQWKLNGLEDCNPPMSNECVCDNSAASLPFCIATAGERMIDDRFWWLSSGFRDLRRLKENKDMSSHWFCSSDTDLWWQEAPVRSFQ